MLKGFQVQVLKVCTLHDACFLQGKLATQRLHTSSRPWKMSMKTNDSNARCPASPGVPQQQPPYPSPSLGEPESPTWLVLPKASNTGLSVSDPLLKVTNSGSGWLGTAKKIFGWALGPQPQAKQEAQNFEAPRRSWEVGELGAPQSALRKAAAAGSRTKWLSCPPIGG